MDTIEQRSSKAHGAGIASNPKSKYSRRHGLHRCQKLQNFDSQIEEPKSAKVAEQNGRAERKVGNSYPNQTSKKLRKGSNAKAATQRLRKGSNAKAPKRQKGDQRMTSQDRKTQWSSKFRPNGRCRYAKKPSVRHEQELTSQGDREKRDMEPEDCLGMLFTPLEVFTATRNRRQFG
jgi:hypothetical protein